MKRTILFTISALTLTQASGKNLTYEFPLEEGCRNYSPKIAAVIGRIRSEAGPSDNVTLRFEKGTYLFHEEGTVQNPRRTAMDFSGIDNLTVDGRGAEFLFEGEMTPITAKGCNNLTLRLFSIDFRHPHTLQFEIVNNYGDGGLVIYLAPWTQYDIDSEGRLVNCGEGWRSTPFSGTVFDSRDRRLVYRLPGIEFDTRGSDSLENRIIESPDWKDPDLKTGMVVTSVSTGDRYPGIFISGSRNIRLEYVTVHYAQGNGLLALDCENIHMDGFRTALREKNGMRYFTTESDATCFIGCRGTVSSKNGLYENMNGAAIDVRSEHLKIDAVSGDRRSVTVKRPGPWTAYWGAEGDSVYIYDPATADIIHRTSVHSVSGNDGSGTLNVILDSPVGQAVAAGFIMDNITRHPSVEFTGNTVRNSKGHGSRFSTRKGTSIVENLFTNISGCAVLLCGDEGGTCRKVLIKGNRFIDVMTSRFDMEEAVISVFPIIGDITGQKGYCCSEITLEGNYFETFDRPVVFAASTDGLLFTKNLIYGDTRYKPFHSNSFTFNFTRVKGYSISGNTYSGYGFDEGKDMQVNP